MQVWFKRYIEGTSTTSESHSTQINSEYEHGPDRRIRNLQDTGMKVETRFLVLVSSRE